MDRVHFNSLDELNVLSYVCEKLSVKVTMPGTYRPDSLIHQVTSFLDLLWKLLYRLPVSCHYTLFINNQ